MKAEIITIGDEILIGQITDTNSSWLGQELGKAGIAVVHRTSVSDDAVAIQLALDAASERAELILLTGGLGPTKDDVTKKTLASYFDCSLVQNEAVLKWVTEIFKSRNLPMIESNIQQAMVPDCCEVLFNKNGTAPGMWFQRNGIVYVSMPGVPFEMKSMFTDEVLPRLKKQFSLPVILHRTILTCAIGESFLARKIAGWEDALPTHIKIAYLPSVGQVRIRLSGAGSDQNKLAGELQSQIDKLYQIAGRYIFGEEDDTLSQVIGRLLNERHQTLSTAESCTGGYIAHQITSVPGSSGYFMGSVVCYDNRIKTDLLGVEPEILETDGAVSEACVKQMAVQIRRIMKTDFAIATSGIAGPGGGTPEKPVGTVWIAIASEQKILTSLFKLGNNRERTIQHTAIQALDMLRRMILDIPDK